MWSDSLVSQRFNHWNKQRRMRSSLTRIPRSSRFGQWSGKSAPFRSGSRPTRRCCRRFRGAPSDGISVSATIRVRIGRLPSVTTSSTSRGLSWPTCCWQILIRPYITLWPNHSRCAPRWTGMRRNSNAYRECSVRWARGGGRYFDELRGFLPVSLLLREVRRTNSAIPGFCDRRRNLRLTRARETGAGRLRSHTPPHGHSAIPADGAAALRESASSGSVR